MRARFRFGVLGVVSMLIASNGAVSAQSPAPPPLPVSAARNGFTPEQARDIRNRYSYTQVISAGDVSLFHFLNLNVWLPTVTVARSGRARKA
jgi:hypothetical protein